MTDIFDYFHSDTPLLIMRMQDFSPGQDYQYVVDVDPASFDAVEVQKVLESAKTIFVNAVMGMMPAFWHGTSKMDEAIDRNTTAQKYFGGGDTLQEFKRSNSQPFIF